MTVAEIVPVKGRGIAVMGRIESGTLRKGEAIIISGKNGTAIATKVVEILRPFASMPESFVAIPCDGIAVLLDLTTANRLEPGMVIIKPSADG